jgi:hypothetical protein
MQAGQRRQGVVERDAKDPRGGVHVDEFQLSQHRSHHFMVGARVSRDGTAAKIDHLRSRRKISHLLSVIFCARGGHPLD